MADSTILKMIEVELEEGLIVTVDQATASELEDPSYAKQYAEMVKSTIMPADPTNKPSESTLWKTKHDIAKDHDATLQFLELRQSYKQEFRDKKNSKNTLWEIIRDHLNEKGYFVGKGLEGREKCRQKFANLKSSYLRCKEKRKGREGKVQDFPYFQQMDEILGDIHQTRPVLETDSLNAEPSCSSDDYKPSPSKKMAYDGPSSSSTVPVNRQRSTEAALKEEFKTMMEVFKQQNETHQKQITALITMSKKM